MRQQSKEPEQKGKTRDQKTLNLAITLLPAICDFTAVVEYWKVSNGSSDSHPYVCAWVVAASMATYVLHVLAAGIEYRKGDRRTAEDLHYRASLFSVFFLLLTLHNYPTPKTGILSQFSVPCMNNVSNVAQEDQVYLSGCTLYMLCLLSLGYLIGVALGLVMGITCGYSEKVRYWISPVIKFLGLVPTTTWIPTTMVMTASLLRGAVLTVTLGSRSAVTVAFVSGIRNVDKDFLEAARTLGAGEGQLVFWVAISHVMPPILQDCTRAMSSSCVAIMITKMMRVRAGLGWYMNQAKSWAIYDKIFAAPFAICFIFTIATKMLDLVERRVLRWQNGAVK